MSAIVFDPLEFTHQLEASGVPRAQAEVHAKAMTVMFLHNIDALVTRDYLDTRFSEFETRVEAKMDRRFAELGSRLDKRFGEIDSCFVELASRLDKRFGEVDGRIVELASRLDKRFGEVDGRIVALGSHMDKRFAEQESLAEKRFGEFRLSIREDLGEMRGVLRLHSWMLAILIASTLLPAMGRLLS